MRVLRDELFSYYSRGFEEDREKRNVEEYEEMHELLWRADDECFIDVYIFIVSLLCCLHNGELLGILNLRRQRHTWRVALEFAQLLGLDSILVEGDSISTNCKDPKWRNPVSG